MVALTVPRFPAVKACCYFDKNGCGDILISTEQHFQGYSKVIWLNDCFGHFTALPNAALGKIGFMIPIDSEGDGDLDFVVERKKFPDFGDNPHERHQDLALLRRVTEPVIANLFADSLCQTGCGSSDSAMLAFLGNKARFIPALNRLFIPSVKVDDRSYQVALSLSPNGASLRFSVDASTLVQLNRTSTENQAFVDGANLIIPMVEIIDGDTVSRFRVTLTLADPATLEFELTGGDPLP